MNKTLEDFLLNKRETLTARVQNDFAAIMKDRLARKFTKESISITTAATAGLSAGVIVAAGLLTGIHVTAQETLGDGPQHKSSVPLMAEYMNKAHGVQALALYKDGDRKRYVLDQKTADVISALSGSSPSGIKNASDAELGSLLEASIATLSNQAFADARLSEKDLAAIHFESGLKTTYSFSGAYRRNECVERGLTEVQACMKDKSMTAPKGLEALFSLGLLAFGVAAGVGGYKLTYREVEDLLDAKLPGRLDRPRQAKFDF